MDPSTLNRAYWPIRSTTTRPMRGTAITEKPVQVADVSPDLLGVSRHQVEAGDAHQQTDHVGVVVDPEPITDLSESSDDVVVMTSAESSLGVVLHGAPLMCCGTRAPRWGTSRSTLSNTLLAGCAQKRCELSGGWESALPTDRYRRGSAYVFLFPSLL